MDYIYNINKLAWQQKRPKRDHQLERYKLADTLSNKLFIFQLFKEK